MGLFDRTMRRNVVITVGTQVLIAVSFVVMLGVLSREFPKDDMGLYGNYKSLLQFLFFLYTFGMDIGLARYLGFYSGNPDMQDRCFSTVAVLYLVIAAGSTVLLYAGADFVVDHFLGGNRLLFHYTVLALALIGVFKIVYTYYQGVQRMVEANLLQLVILAGGNFLVTVLVWTGVIRQLEQVLLLLSGVLGLAIVPLLILVRRRFCWRFNFREIIAYSFPRAPHIFLSGVILTFGIMLASYFYSYSLAGDFTVTTRLFRILGMGAYGFNMVLLPGVAALKGAGRDRELSHSLGRYGNLVMHVGLAAMFGCYVLSPVMIRMWVTNQYLSAVPILRILSFSIPLYLYYLMFRSAIHGMDERPIQLGIDLASFLAMVGTFFLLGRWMNDPARIIAVAMVVAFAVSGWLSMVYLHRYAAVSPRVCSWTVHGILVLVAMGLSHWHVSLSMIVFVLAEGALWFFIRREWMDLFRR